MSSSTTPTRSVSEGRAGGTFAGLTAGTRRLRTLYILALSAVAALSIAGQWLVQRSLQQQLGDATVVNIAGRQRMLSQRIAKAALVVAHGRTPAERTAAMAELHESLTLWQRSHAGLLQGDAEFGLPGHPSAAVAAMFAELQPSLETIESAASELLQATQAGRETATAEANKASPLDRILQAEPNFLAGMDRIVFQYNHEAESRVARLKLMERLLLALTLAVLATEGWFVFRPAVEGLQSIGCKLQAATDELIEAQQAAEAASEAKSRFLANMSHELRTPLHAILTATELAQSRRGASLPQEQLTTIADAGNLLLGLVNDLLDMAKIEAGKFELLPSPTNLVALATGVTALLKASASQQGLALNCHIDPQLSPHVLADQQRLKQVFVNLLGNAIKFTDAGNVTLTLQQTATANDHVNVRFSVQDTGVGISLAEQSRIFDRFTQADTSIQRRHGGAGLGLAISAHLVGLMGSQIKVHSAPGQGSEFEFELQFPLAAVPEANKEERQDQPRNWHGLFVLAAEDSPVIRRLIEQSLTAQGCRVRLAADGEEAIAACLQEMPDVLLVDVHMPGRDGPQVAEALCTISAACNREPPPIIAITADALPATRTRCLAAGMGELLIKPFRQRDLLAAIDRAVQRSNDLQPAAPESFDPDTIALDDALARLGDRSELLRELAELFLTEAPRVIAELRSAAERGAAAQVRQLAHRLRGQIAIFERGDALQAARELEDSPLDACVIQGGAAIERLDLAVADLSRRLSAAFQLVLPSPFQQSGWAGVPSVRANLT